MTILSPVSGIVSANLLNAEMKIEIRVKPGAKQTAVEKSSDGNYIVKVKAPAREGRANEAVVEFLAGHFGIPKRSVTIVRGQASRNKLVEIQGPYR